MNNVKLIVKENKFDAVQAVQDLEIVDGYFIKDIKDLGFYQGQCILAVILEKDYTEDLHRIGDCLKGIGNSVSMLY